MGLNTTVLVLNDRLGDIEKDQKLGELLALAIQQQHDPKDGPLNPVGNGVYVIETHHADYTAVVLVGGNTARVLMHLKTDSPRDDAKVAVELSKWPALKLLLAARKQEPAQKDALDTVSHLMTPEELNTLAKKKGFRLVALRRKNEKPKRLTTKKGK